MWFRLRVGNCGFIAKYNNGEGVHFTSQVTYAFIHKTAAKSFDYLFATHTHNIYNYLFNKETTKYTLL